MIKSEKYQEAKSDDYTTRCLLDYAYLKYNYYN